MRYSRTIAQNKNEKKELRGRRKIDLVPLNVKRRERIQRVASGKTLKNSGIKLYLAKSFTESLGTSEFHDSMIIFNFFN